MNTAAFSAGGPISSDSMPAHWLYFETQRDDPEQDHEQVADRLQLASAQPSAPPPSSGAACLELKLVRIRFWPVNHVLEMLPDGGEFPKSGKPPPHCLRKSKARTPGCGNRKGLNRHDHRRW